MTNKRRDDEEQPNELQQREPGSPYMQEDGVAFPQTEQLQREGKAEGAAKETYHDAGTAESKGRPDYSAAGGSRKRRARER